MILSKAKLSIAEGDINQGLSLLLKEYGDNDLVLLKSRLKSIKKQLNTGVISSIEYNIEINKITLSLLDYIELKRKSNGPSSFRRFRWTFLFFFLGLVISGIVWRNLDNNEIRTGLSNQTDEDGKFNFKVLVMPFNPYKNCTIEENGIEMAQIDYLEKIFKDEGLPISFEYFDDGDCPYSIEAINKIKNEKDADIVLWGRYIENCDDDEIQINFQSSEDEMYYRILQSEYTNIDTFYKLSGVQEILTGKHQTELIFTIYNSFVTKYLIAGAVTKEFNTYIQEYFKILTSGLKYFSKNPLDLSMTLHSIHETFAIAYVANVIYTDSKSIEPLHLFSKGRGDLGSFIIKEYELSFYEHIDFVHLTRGIQILIDGDLTHNSYSIENEPLIRGAINVYVAFAYQYYLDNKGWKDNQSIKKYLETYFEYVKKAKPFLSLGHYDKIY